MTEKEKKLDWLIIYNLIKFNCTKKYKIVSLYHMFMKLIRVILNTYFFAKLIIIINNNNLT